MPDSGLNIAGRKWGGDPHAGRLVVPDRCHPLVKRLFAIMNEQRVCMRHVASGTGVHHDTIASWRYRWAPTIASMEAVLNKLGYELVIRPKRGE
jgi:hypothetical protein